MLVIDKLSIHYSSHSSEFGDGEFGSLLQFSAPLCFFLIKLTKQKDLAKYIYFITVSLISIPKQL